MPDEKLKLFRATIYNAAEKVAEGDEWKRQSDAYVAAKNMNAATALAKANCTEDEIVIGINELIDSKFYI